MYHLDNPDLLTLLVDYVDDIEMRDGLQWTPLMTAVNRGSKENVKVLLKHGAKIDCDSNKGMDLIASAMAFHDAGNQAFFSFLDCFFCCSN